VAEEGPPLPAANASKAAGESDTGAKPPPKGAPDLAARPQAVDLPKVRYKVKAMDKDLETEDKIPHPIYGLNEPVRYLNAEQRAAAEVHVKDGLLYDSTGKLINFHKKRLFVMSGEGKIYFGSSVRGIYHHSSLLAGAPAAAAGEIVVHGGRISTLSKRSGHYQHEDEYIRQFISELERRGVPGVRKLKIQNALPDL